MIVYDDTSSEQVRVYDRGVDVIEPQSFGEYQLSYRSGDILTPAPRRRRAAAPRARDFVAAIRDGRPPRSSRSSASRSCG